MEKLNNDQIRDLLSKTSVDLDYAAEWSAIEGHLDKDDSKRRVFWYWLFAGSIFVLAVGSILYMQVTQLGDLGQSSSSEVVTTQNESTASSTDRSAGKTALAQQELSSTTASKVIVTSTDKNKKVVNRNMEQPSTIQAPPKSNEAALETEISPLTTSGEVTSFETPAEASRPATTSYTTSVAYLPILDRELESPDRKLPTPLEWETTVLASSPQYELYIENTFASVGREHTTGVDDEYLQRLSTDYDILSSYMLAAGATRRISSNWTLMAGLHYQSYRAVYRGTLIDEVQELTYSDTATVLTNSLGGTIYQSGDIVQKTTTTTTIQQYNYQHRLGLTAGAQYNILGPLYTGATISWTPITWYTGSMVSRTNAIVPLTSLSSAQNSLRLSLELGWRSQLVDRVSLDMGIRYDPSHLINTVDGVQVHASALGGTVRIRYRL